MASDEIWDLFSLVFHKHFLLESEVNNSKNRKGVWCTREYSITAFSHKQETTFTPSQFTLHACLKKSSLFSSNKTPV